MTKATQQAVTQPDTKTEKTVSERLTTAINASVKVKGKAYDKAIMDGKVAEGQQAEYTRKLLLPVFIAYTFKDELADSDSVIKQAFKATEVVANELAALHSTDKDVKNNVLSKYRVNIQRAIASFNVIAKDAGTPEIDKRISVKAVNNTAGTAFSAKFKDVNVKESVKVDKGDGTSEITLAIPNGVDATAQMQAILRGIQQQLGKGEKALFSDADGKPLSLANIADLLLDSVTN